MKGPESLDHDIRTAFETLSVYQNKESLEHFSTDIQPGRLLENREFLASGWRSNGYYFCKEPFSDVKELFHPALIILGRQDSISERLVTSD